MRLVSEAQKAEAAKKEDGGKSREGERGGERRQKRVACTAPNVSCS